MKNQKYNKSVSLYHNEIPVAIDQETGEIRNLSRPKLSVDKTLINEEYTKSYVESWKKLYQKVSTAALCSAIEIETTLNWDNSICKKTELIKKLQGDRFSRPTVTKNVKELQAANVIALADGVWYFNPYISRKTKDVSDFLERLFCK